ncbi:MAG TPA: MgtC/SapB family protein [Caulobacteraceae bacterium]|jgi:putative Mg2+ transporter-C (MgtC) family protein
MPLYPSWEDIGLRLALTLVACGLIGFDRGARGHAAGLRTTMLVGLAAAVAMIQANILLPVAGKTPASFAVMDLMRLPLGILTGVGFIGGGTILKRGDLVSGVTTAATIWLTTVIGLCFGGGQLGLGVASTVLAMITLLGLKWLDLRIPREHRARLVISVDAGTSPGALAPLLEPLGYEPRFRQQDQDDDSGRVRLGYDVRWRRPELAGPPLDLVEAVGRAYRLLSFELTAESPE